MKQDYQIKETLISAKNINLQYENRQILRDINFEIKDVTRVGIEQGQVVALVGRSGLGKTQLFKIIAGLKKPTSGQVLITTDQHLVTPGEVGIIPQNYILFDHRTVYHNLRRGITHCGKKCNGKDSDDLIRKHAEDFGLTEHLQKYPAQLSGGQKQRVSIIQQILTDNKFILLDEPFSGLDTIIKDKVIKLLIKISTMNELNTLIIVSHDLESSMAIADTVWLLALEPEKQGATITKTYDLKEMGMAWDPGIRERPDFLQFVKTVTHEL
jgi:ABC-type nitrate/sulfonate/bicarbonate transport system ATPase subunit